MRRPRQVGAIRSRFDERVPEARGRRSHGWPSRCRAAGSGASAGAVGNDAVKLLAVGDIHLGRTPSRLPADLSARELGPAEAWRRTVEAAVESGASAVLLAGDVVDRDEDFFEAYRQLESGVRRLADADIAVVGVAGNHDVEVLPRLARHIPEFRLLGAGGRWESCRIASRGEAVTLWGWSFPRARFPASPLADQRFERASGINLGLLHCDRDAGAESPYAPVSGEELRRAGLDGWLLGHIHRPDALSADAPGGYLGSLTGLHRGESGPRGPWMLRVADGRIAEISHLPIAPLRWETLEVDLEGIGEAAEARERLLAAMIALDERISSAPVMPRAVGLSVTFTGRTAFGRFATEAIPAEDREAIHRGSAGTRYFIHRVDAETRPEVDLDELARRRDPVGLLAARLLRLGLPEGEPERERLLGLARRRLAAESGKTVWRGLAPSAGEPDPVEWLQRAGFRALDLLMEQGSSSPETR